MIAYLVSWKGTAKPVEFQIEPFKNRTDAVAALAVLEHKELDRSGKVIDDIKGLEGVGSSFLVAMYNAIMDETQKGFHDAATGRKKVWDALTTKYPDPDPVQPEQATSNQEGETSANSGEATDAEGKTTMATKTSKKAPKVKKTKVAGEKKSGPGVIDTIVEILQNKGGTVEQITEKLAKKFPDKSADGLKATVKIQVNRLSKPKDEGGRGLKVKKESVEGSNEKHYFI